MKMRIMPTLRPSNPEAIAQTHGRCSIADMPFAWAWCYIDPTSIGRAD